jgi:predicted transposase/invertase (TIGR01784 family)
MESQYQEGMEKGMEKGIQTVAQSMRDNHVPIDQIVRCTGLTAEEIARL